MQAALSANEPSNNWRGLVIQAGDVWYRGNNGEELSGQDAENYKLLCHGDQLRKNLYRSNDTRLQQSMSVLTFEQIKESSKEACMLREAI